VEHTDRLLRGSLHYQTLTLLRGSQAWSSGWSESNIAIMPQHLTDENCYALFVRTYTTCRGNAVCPPSDLDLQLCDAARTLAASSFPCGDSWQSMSVFVIPLDRWWRAKSSNSALESSWWVSCLQTEAIYALHCKRRVQRSRRSTDSN
jgi:hypothetical protein